MGSHQKLNPSRKDGCSLPHVLLTLDEPRRGFSQCYQQRKNKSPQTFSISISNFCCDMETELIHTIVLYPQVFDDVLNQHLRNNLIRLSKCFFYPFSVFQPIIFTCLNDEMFMQMSAPIMPCIFLWGSSVE